MSRNRRPERGAPAKDDAQSSHKPNIVRGAIEEALQQTVKCLKSRVEKTAALGSMEEVLKAMPKVVMFAQRAQKLACLANPSSKPLSFESAIRLAELWRKTNPPEAEVEKILHMAGKKAKGRPATLRGVGLQALELRTVDSRHWTWKALAELLCRCGRPQHSFECRENIRREVLLLKRVLGDLGVKLPT